MRSGDGEPLSGSLKEWLCFLLQKFCCYFINICLQRAVVGCKFSTSSSRLLKFYNSGEEAVKDIPEGAKLLVGGQYWCYT